MPDFGKYQMLFPLPDHPGEYPAYVAALRGFGGFRKLVVLREVPTAHLQDNDAAYQAFLREAKTVATFHHPNVAGVFDLEAVEGRLLLATEFTVGVSLGEIATAFRSAHVHIPLGLVATALRDAALALHYAHTFISPDGGASTVSHGALTADSLQVTFSGVTQVLDFGAPKLKAVERTPAADLAALGALVPVVLADQPQDVALVTRSDMSPEMRAVFARLSGVRQPYANALEFAHALEQVAGSILWRAEHSAALMQSTFKERQTEWEELVKRSEDLGGSSTSVMPLAKVLGSPTTAPAPLAKPTLQDLVNEPPPDSGFHPIANEPTDVKRRALPIPVLGAALEIDTGVRPKVTRPAAANSGRGRRLFLMLLLLFAIPGLVVAKWKKDPDFIRARSPELAKVLGRLSALIPGFPPAEAPAPPPSPVVAEEDAGTVSLPDAGAGIPDAGPPVLDAGVAAKNDRGGKPGPLPVPKHKRGR